VPGSAGAGRAGHARGCYTDTAGSHSRCRPDRGPRCWHPAARPPGGEVRAACRHGGRCHRGARAYRQGYPDWHRDQSRLCPAMRAQRHHRDRLTNRTAPATVRRGRIIGRRLPARARGRWRRCRRSRKRQGQKRSTRCTALPTPGARRHERAQRLAASCGISRGTVRVARAEPDLLSAADDVSGVVDVLAYAIRCCLKALGATATPGRRPIAAHSL
jgi:hypothetical protein